MSLLFNMLSRFEQLHFHFSLSCIGEGNSNPLQCSCLEIPREEGASWAAVYGVAQSQTWLKQLSSSSSRPFKDFRVMAINAGCAQQSMHDPALLQVKLWYGKSSKKLVLWAIPNLTVRSWGNLTLQHQISSGLWNLDFSLLRQGHRKKPALSMSSDLLLHSHGNK